MRPLLLLLAPLALLVGGEAVPVVDWAAIASQPGYAEATAHAPRFDDVRLWPGLRGDEPWVRQAWPKGQLYVWAHPGEGTDAAKGAKGATHGLLAAGSWLENGQPVAKPVFDQDTDILLPASASPYLVSTGELGGAQIVRHATVGAGARLGGGGDGKGRSFLGNLWIKRGGSTYAQGGTRIMGAGSAFLRNDNPVPPAELNEKGGAERVSQYISFTKEGGAAVLVAGHVTVLDEFNVACPVTLWIGSRLQPGRNAAPRISKGGQLTLREDAYFGLWNDTLGSSDILLDGELRGGSPERPLQRPARVGLHHKGVAGRPFPDPQSKDAEKLARPMPSLVLGDGAQLRSHHARPEARLQVGLADQQVCVQVLHHRKYAKNASAETKDAVEAWWKGLPRLLTIQAGSGCAVEGVLFDAIAAGGIAAKGHDGWKELAWGPACVAQGEALFAR